MRIPRRSPAAAWQRVDGEMVLMQADAGELVGVNPVGARTWELVDGARSAAEIAAAISSEFRAPLADVERDVNAFLDELAAAKLVDFE